jgi:cysteine-S-conjugate beta-lyase
MSTNWRTKLIHSECKVPQGFRSLATPVFRGSTTLFRRASAIVDTWDQDEVPYTYGSYGTPTTLELGARIAELEGGYRSFVTPGGQSALILIYMACLSAGNTYSFPKAYMAQAERSPTRYSAVTGWKWNTTRRSKVRA